MIKEEKIRSLYYLMVIIIVILGCIYMAAKTIKMNKYDDTIIFSSNIEESQTFVPPDIVPHIREIEEKEGPRFFQPDPEYNPDGIEYC